MNRRQFLRRSGLAAAAVGTAPLILPGNILGAEAPSKKVSVGLIGLGRQTQIVNIPGFLSLDNCQVVAICDVDSWRLQKAKDQIESHYAR